jgi:molybdate transport system ATP-binding protein
VLDEGRILQVGSPDVVFSRPADLKVAQILGVDTVAPAVITSVEEGLAHLTIQGQQLLAAAPNFGDKNVYACIRAEDVILLHSETGSFSARNRLEGVVTGLVPEGPFLRITIDCGFPLMALITRPARHELNLEIGSRVQALIKAPAIHLLSRHA